MNNLLFSDFFMVRFLRRISIVLDLMLFIYAQSLLVRAKSPVLGHRVPMSSVVVVLSLLDRKVIVSSKLFSPGNKPVIVILERNTILLSTVFVILHDTFIFHHASCSYKKPVLQPISLNSSIHFLRSHR